MKRLRFWLFNLLAGGLLILVSVVILEIAARSLGHTPYKPEQKKMVMEPAGRFFEPDSETGFRCREGHFTFTLEDSLTFTCTNNSRGHRITYNPDQFVLNEPQKTIWIFGGSYTYGWSVSDSEAYPRLVQQAYPSYRVVNFGVPGFGTLQSYLQYKQALDNHCAPDLVILAYAGFHDMRNINSRLWSKTLAPYNQLGPIELPFAELTDEGNLSVSSRPLAYTPFRWQDKLALANAFEGYYNRQQLEWQQANRISIALVDSFAQLTAACMSRFVLAAIVDDSRSQNLTTHCHTLCIEYADISVDTRLPGMTNEPYDSHPSARAHQLYAEKLLPLLTDAE